MSYHASPTAETPTPATRTAPTNKHNRRSTKEYLLHTSLSLGAYAGIGAIGAIFLQLM